MITLETVGYCRDIDFNDSLLVAAADQNGYVIYSIDFGSDGSFTYDEIYGTDPEDHEGEEFQGGGVRIASRYNYFLLMDQADALYYVNFADVDSVGRIPYPGSENRDYVRGFSIDEEDEDNLLLYSLNRAEDGNSTFISTRILPYFDHYYEQTGKIDFYGSDLYRLEGLNQDAENLHLSDSLLVVANSQMGVSVFRQNSDGSLDASTFAAYDISGGYEVQTVMTQDGVVFAGLSNDGGCHIAKVEDNGEIISEIQIAEGYSVQGIDLKDDVLALACGSDGVLLYEWNGFDFSTALTELGRLNSDYAYNVKVYDTQNIFTATRAGIQLFQLGE